MHSLQNRWWLLLLLLCLCGLFPSKARAQIDPVPRELIQFGYNASFEGHAPLAAYAFYYRNQPAFIRSNLTLRLAVAPTYVDSELGIRQAVADDTDLGIGLAGGGFGDSYDEIRSGRFLPRQSFVGHGAETSVSLYHCFNPNHIVPLNGVIRGSLHYSWFNRDSDTAPTFILPDDRATLALRTGLRWGGKEPTLFPSLAMELSIWYEGQFRSSSGSFGLTNLSGGLDRRTEPWAHQFWAQALLAYTFTNTGQSFFVSLIGGTSIDADRFSAYRLGALLPLVSEFPLSLPGYYNQELNAKNFVLLGGNYIVPLDHADHWNVNFAAATAGVDYLDGFRQPGNWHSGVGIGILYKSAPLKVMVGYGYGIDAIRTDGRGAHSIGILMQIDWEHTKGMLFGPEQPGRWRGFQRIIGAFDN